MTTFADFALPNAPTVVRLFLPLVDTADDDLTTAWEPVTSAAGLEFTGYLSWTGISGWGTGNGDFASRWEPPMGRAPDHTISSIVELLSNVTGRQDGWTFTPFPEIGTPEHLDNDVITSLDRYAALWTGGPLPGSLRHGTQVQLCAPAYADSVIVSGPATIASVAQALGLEVATVSPCQQLPVMVW